MIQNRNCSFPRLTWFILHRPEHEVYASGAAVHNQLIRVHVQLPAMFLAHVVLPLQVQLTGCPQSLHKDLDVLHKVHRLTYMTGRLDQINFGLSLRKKKVLINNVPSKKRLFITNQFWAFPSSSYFSNLSL